MLLGQKWQKIKKIEFFFGRNRFQMVQNVFQNENIEFENFVLVENFFRDIQSIFHPRIGIEDKILINSIIFKFWTFFIKETDDQYEFQN